MLIRRFRRRRLYKAVKILQKRAKRHQKQGHMTDLIWSEHEQLISFHCTSCPDPEC